METPAIHIISFLIGRQYADILVKGAELIVCDWGLASSEQRYEQVL